MPFQVSTSKAHLYHSPWHTSTQSPSGASCTISIRDMFALVNLSREVSIAQVLSTSSLSFFTQQPITKLAKSLFPFCRRCFAAANSSSVFLIPFSTINSEMFKLESRRSFQNWLLMSRGHHYCLQWTFSFQTFRGMP